MRQIASNVVALDDQRIATRSLSPGQRVYGEDLMMLDGAEHRVWDPTRSKLGAYIVKGGRHFPINDKSQVIYLGAANGTTPSHVSDIVSNGMMVAVEFSPRSYRDLLNMSLPRNNIVPILADAWRPELYERYIGKVDFVFQDIAQRQQAQIFAKNLARFKPAWGMVAVKARSVNVAANPRDVYDQVAKDIESLVEYEVIETIDLGPFEKDHAAIVVRPRTGGAKRAEPQREERREERRDDRRDTRRDDRPRDDRPRDDRRSPPRDGGFRREGPPPERRGGGGGWAPRGGGGGGGGAPPPRRDDRPAGGDKPKWQPKPDRRGWR